MSLVLAMSLFLGLAMSLVLVKLVIYWPNLVKLVIYWSNLVKPGQTCQNSNKQAKWHQVR